MFPLAQYEKVILYRPQEFLPQLNNFLRTWVIHPLKRRIAKYYLIFLNRLFGLKVIAITGSAGKTTTKEMVASILKRKKSIVSSFANIDPIYNIPSTILKCKPSTAYLVLEMGVEYPGEMDFYLWLAKPDIAIITNIYPTHTLYFNNIRGVAGEKEKIAKAVGESGYVVLNAGNEFTKGISKISKARVFLFGAEGEISASKIKYTQDYETRYRLQIGKISKDIRLPILGRQFVENSLAAASVSHLLGFTIDEIKKGLERFSRPDHRMKTIRLRSGALLIDDSYNNNPAAAKESLEVFKEISKYKKRIIVFGDMLELGNMEVVAHKKIAGRLTGLVPSKLICVGALSAITSREAKKELKEKVVWVADAGEALKILKASLSKESAILVKGSRSLGLERIISGLS